MNCPYCRKTMRLIDKDEVHIDTVTDIRKLYPVKMVYHIKYTYFCDTCKAPKCIHDEIEYLPTREG